MIVLLALAAETLLPTRAAAPPFVVNVLYALAAGDALIALVYRWKFSAPAAEALRANPEDAAALANWMKGQMVPLPMALGVGCMGLAARALGVSTLHSAPLFIGSVLLLLSVRPAELSL